MMAQKDSCSESVPLPAAPLSAAYPQFYQTDVPIESNAESAWVGEIRPFDDDIAARAFLQAMEERREVWISSGNIHAGSHSRAHWADPLLVGMPTVCKLLVLVQPAPAHPRAYLLSPRFADHYAFFHPHSRADLKISWKGKDLPGMCVYSAAEFAFVKGTDMYMQFLDQATLYVARHLIWLRTRQLYRGLPPAGTVIYIPRPGELIISDRPVQQRRIIGGREEVQLEYWAGYWPGPIARAMGPKEHIRSIRPNQECWCGSGELYGTCHRSIELLSMG